MEKKMRLGLHRVPLDATIILYDYHLEYLALTAS